MPSFDLLGTRDSTPPIRRAVEAATAQDAPRAKLGRVNTPAPVASDRRALLLLRERGAGGVKSTGTHRVSSNRKADEMSQPNETEQDRTYWSGDRANYRELVDALTAAEAHEGLTADAVLIAAAIRVGLAELTLEVSSIRGFGIAQASNRERG